MKGNFIPKFIKAVIDFGIDFYQPFTWTPIYYKGVHVLGSEHKKHYGSLRNLQYRGIIKNVGQDQYEFTKKGRVWFNISLLKYHQAIGTKWDKKWRLVIFDIPQEFHNQRNKFRQKLQTLGFYKVQKSVFAFPYPCEEELVGFCEQFKLSDYINIIKADDLGFASSEAKRFFKL